jgi:hypothetical protein
MSNTGIPLRIIQEISGHSNLEQLQREERGEAESSQRSDRQSFHAFLQRDSDIPDQRLASGQLSTPTARDLSLPSRAPTISHSYALNSAFACSIVLA